MVTWKLPWRNGSAKPAPPEPGDRQLLPVASGMDEAVPSSVALEECGFDDGAVVVLRHLLRVPQSQLAVVTERCVSHGYVIDPGVESDVVDNLILLPVAQATVVDAVVLSRERARWPVPSRERVVGSTAGWCCARRILR